MATVYQNPEEASAGLTTAFAPTNDAQKSAIAGAAALVPGASAAPVLSPIQRTIDPGASAAESYLGKFTAPQSADQIAEQMRQGSQGLTDSLNKTADDAVLAARKTGDERLSMDNA